MASLHNHGEPFNFLSRDKNEIFLMMGCTSFCTGNTLETAFSYYTRVLCNFALEYFSETYKKRIYVR